MELYRVCGQTEGVRTLESVQDVAFRLSTRDFGHSEADGVSEHGRDDDDSSSDSHGTMWILPLSSISSSSVLLWYCCIAGHALRIVLM